MRGAGIYQPTMNQCVEKLNNCDWIHIFPEGRVYQHPSLEINPLRWGIGRLIMESKEPPIVMCFWHKGLELVVPESSRLKYPRLGKRVYMGFGEPINTAKIIKEAQERGLDEIKCRIFITNKMESELRRVREEVLSLIQADK